ncbi:MAG TPA: hypothetical protein PL005_09680, partial [Candidatus Hydrogenedentes bacterium]|nr:hypothetical protein [Candidatus Hydrogenedentota bacterium]
MMRRSCVFFAALAVVAAAGAGAVVVNEGEDLAAAINGAAAGEVIQLKSTSGTGAAWPLSAPVTVIRDLTIEGESGLLPVRSIIEGNSAAGTCPGNAVDNGDFEAGQTPTWPSNPPAPPVIVQDPARAASGEWLAQFTLDPCVPQTPDLAPDQVELRYIHPTPVPGLPPVGPARVDWMTLPMPPPVLGTILTVWIKAHMPVAGNRLVVTLTDSGGIAGTAFIEDADLTAAADWLAVPLPLNTFVPALSPAETVMSLSIESQFTVGAPDDPPCALIGGVEFGAAAPALPTPSALNLGLALPGPGASLVELAAPFAGAPQALSLGGLVPPALRFSVRADIPQPGDKLELLPRPGEAAVWSAASETLAGPNCQTFSVPVPPPDPVFPVFRATLQPPAAVAGPVTRFIIDDFSLSTLGAWLFAQVVNAGGIPNGDMEDVGLASADWSAATPCEILAPPLPPSYFTGPGCGPSASALLLTREPGGATVVTLTQDVTFPSAGEEIRFKLRVGQPGGADSIFTFDVDGTVLHTAESDDAALAAGWTDVIVPYPAAWHNTTKTLRFSAELTGGVAPPSFLIDDVCVGLPPAGPVLTVANTASLRLENLMVSNGTTGVTVTDTASLEFVRCAVQSVSGAGLYFSSSGTGYASSSFFSGCGGPAVLSDSTGTVTVYQCTARSNLGGVQANAGNINLAVSLLDTGDAGGQVHTWLNLIRSDVFPAGLEQPGFENLDPATPVNFAGTPWGGKLDALNPVLSGHTITAGDPVLSLLPAAADRAYDFDGDERPSLEGEQIQVGADQEGGTVGAPVWLSCSVTPDVVGRGEPVTITVVTQGMDLGIASLRIVPEEPLAGMTELPDAYIPTQCYEIPLAGGMTDANTATVTLTFADPCDRRSVMDTPLCAEGINRIYLNDGTDNTNPVLYGDGMPGPTDPAFTSCSFLVDTTPPTLLFAASANGDAATAQPRAYGNDSLVGTGVPGPQGQFFVPVSGGTIVDRALHFLFNPGGNGTCADTAAGDTLSFGIEAVFEDRPPAPLTHVTTSGFESDTSGTDFTARGDGRAWLEGPLGPTDSGTTAVILSTDPEAAVKRLTARFEAVTSQSVPDPWRFEGKPAASDRASNEIGAPNPLVLWWMWRAQAEIT